jgi:hypothetical protein
MQLLFFTIILVALCVFLLSFNIIFRKNGKFPDGEIGHNKEMKKLGIKCAKAEEKELWGVHGTMRKECPSDTCINCRGRN